MSFNRHKKVFIPICMIFGFLDSMHL